MSIDDATLLAYVDGELDAERQAAVEAALAADPELSARVSRHAALRRRVAETYAPVLDEPVPERLLALVQGAGGAEIADLAAERERRRRSLPAWAAMAASLVVGVLAGVGLTQFRSHPLVGAGGEGLEAKGQLARALDQQLASAQGEQPIRIGLSFLSTDRRYCRTFQAQALAGLACKAPEGWRVQLAVAQAGESQRGAYRMAATEIPPQVLQTAQAMMAGAPLDAAGEAAAKAKGWRP